MSDDYIERSVAIEIAQSNLNPISIIKWIKNLPSADVTPVVRCKDCASFRYSGMGGDNGITYCALLMTEMQPTDFCSYGEKKDE